MARCSRRNKARQTVAAALAATAVFATAVQAAPSSSSLASSWIDAAPVGWPLASWFSSSLPSWLSSAKTVNPEERPSKTFKLRSSVHKGVFDYPDLLAWGTISSNTDRPALSLKSTKQSVRRARDPRAYVAARGMSLESAQCATREMLDWEDVEIDAPDTSDRETLLMLAKMAAQAYDNTTDTWEPGYGGFNLSDSFGWVEDGIRGHLFTTEDNSTVVLALKGTSAQFLPGGGDTAKRDKANDNLLFSCCCARVSWTWTPVCDCFQGKGSCGQTCLERALVEKSFYYPATTDLYNNVSYLYPDSQIWITGHSLGGALSSLIGMTFGIPTVTFEAPGDRLAAMRLHLPMPPPKDPEDSPVSALPITHVYHTGDPIAGEYRGLNQPAIDTDARLISTAVGGCVGALSPCAEFGYAMESKCHAGKSIVYDTVGQLGWSSSLLTHRIVTLTDDLLTEDWDKRVKKAQGRLAGQRFGISRWKWPWRSGSGDGDGGDDQHGRDDLGSVPPRLSEDKCKGAFSQLHWIIEISH